LYDAKPVTTDNKLGYKQVAQLWQRDRAKLDTFRLKSSGQTDRLTELRSPRPR